MDETSSAYERRWDEQTAPPVTATVIVGSDAGHGDPGPQWVPNRTAPWRSIERNATAAGWSSRFTYALALWPDQYHGNGNMKKSQHYVHTLALRLTRPGRRAFAVWLCETPDVGMPPRGWSYWTGFAVPATDGLALSLAAWKTAVLG